VVAYADKANSKSPKLDSIHPGVLNEYKDQMAKQLKIVCNCNCSFKTVLRPVHFRNCIF